MAWRKFLLEGDAVENPSGASQGDILYYNGSTWTRLPAGTSGQLLATGGSGANPYWTDAAGTTDEKVKADSNDPTAGFLADKVDGATLEEDATNHVIGVKDGGITVAKLNINADLPMNYHALLNAVVENVSELPATGNEVAGQIVFNTADGHLYVFEV